MFELEVRDLHSKHHHGLNWNLKKNEIHGIIGPSGEGKSYFLKILLGIFQYHSGRILNAKGEKWAFEKESVAIQFQNGALINDLSVGQNIMLPLIYKYNMSDFAAGLIAKSYLKKVGLSENTFDLFPLACSGGMQKRIALARALIVDPKILFLDEPTAGLDCFMLDVYDNLIEAIRNDSASGITIVMVTHDLARLWRLADRISILIAGKMYTGTFQELVEHKNDKVRDFLSTYLKVNAIGL